MSTTIEKALTSGHKVRIDFRNEELRQGFFIVFDKYTELAKMLNVVIMSVDDYGCDGIDYQKTIYLSEEEEVCSGAVAEA